MKKTLFPLIVTLLVSVSSVSFANNPATSVEDPTFQSRIILRPESMKLDVYAETVEKGHLKISLLDEEGRLISTQRVNKTIKGIRFDIAKLQDGIYQIKITDGATKQVENVELKTSLQRSLSLQ